MGANPLCSAPELSARLQHKSLTQGDKGGQGPHGSQPLQLELAMLSLPALSVLHRHDIISAHGHRFFPVCSHKSPRHVRTSQLRCEDQHSTMRSRHGKPDRNDKVTWPLKKIKAKMPSCYPGHITPQM